MKPRKRKSNIRETIEAVVVAFLIALVIRTFVIQAFKIPSGSMIPTLLVGDHILVNKFLLGTPVDIPFTNITLFRMPGLRKAQRGDIIVFKYPEDPKRDFIKRVIGVGGDVVMSKDKNVYVNGRRLVEPYTQHVDEDIKPGQFDKRDNFGPVVVPGGGKFSLWGTTGTRVTTADSGVSSTILRLRERQSLFTGPGTATKHGCVSAGWGGL